MEKIIIDTDIGDAVDDAFTIVLSLVSDNIEIMGITSVFRNAHRRAQMAKTLLLSYNKNNVPVYKGIDYPLIEKINTWENDTFDENAVYYPHQFKKEMEDIKFDEGNAVDFIVDTILKYPNQITIIAIGPLTNIALAISKNPEIINKIKCINIMGGYYFKEEAEWNIICDPEAAQIVISSGVAINIVGLDVTNKCVLSSQQIELIKDKGKFTTPVLWDMLESWLIKYEGKQPILHDPLTVAILEDKSFVKFEKKYVKVNLCENRAVTKLVETKYHGVGHVNIAVDIDNQRYMDYLINKIFERENNE